MPQCRGATVSTETTPQQRKERRDLSLHQLPLLCIRFSESQKMIWSKDTSKDLPHPEHEGPPTQCPFLCPYCCLRHRWHAAACVTQGIGRRKQVVSPGMRSPLAPLKSFTRKSEEWKPNDDWYSVWALKELKSVGPKNAVVYKKCCRNAVIHPMPPGICDPEKLEEVFLCWDYFFTNLSSHLLNPSNALSQHAPATSSTLQPLFFVPMNILLHLPYCFYCEK